MKSFLSVMGDGISSLENLIAYDNRAQHYVKMLEKDHKENWNRILGKGEIILLSVIGNHCKGTQFINGNHLIDEKLTETLDRISHQIIGWYYGRLDVKYNTLEELREGENFIILEINGIISEPTHIYDPYHATYFQALTAIRRHWKYIYNIAKINLQNGVPSKNFFVFWREIKWLKTYVKNIERLTKLHS